MIFLYVTCAPICNFGENKLLLLLLHPWGILLAIKNMAQMLWFFFKIWSNEVKIAKSAENKSSAAEPPPKLDPRVREAGPKYTVTYGNCTAKITLVVGTPPMRLRYSE